MTKEVDKLLEDIFSLEKEVEENRLLLIKKSEEISQKQDEHTKVFNKIGELERELQLKYTNLRVLALRSK